MRLTGIEANLILESSRHDFGVVLEHALALLLVDIEPKAAFVKQALRDHVRLVGLEHDRTAIPDRLATPESEFSR